MQEDLEAFAEKSRTAASLRDNAARNFSANTSFAVKLTAASKNCGSSCQENERVSGRLICYKSGQVYLFLTGIWRKYRTLPAESFFRSYMSIA